MKPLRIAIAIAALTAAGCTDLPLDTNGGSGGDFDITVGTGTTPSYSWPGGPAFEVSVVRTSDETVFIWRIADSVNQNIAPPVRHGTVPVGAFELEVREATLTPGVRYRVAIKLPNGDAAFRDFTP